MERQPELIVIQAGALPRQSGALIVEEPEQRLDLAPGQRHFRPPVLVRIDFDHALRLDVGVARSGERRAELTPAAGPIG